MANGPGWFSESASQVASIGDIMFEGHWRWVNNALRATADAVENINRNAYPAYGGRGARSGSGEGRPAGRSARGFRHKAVRSRFNRS
ncbi:MAG: bacteriochlorophyll c-binding protein [Chloroflexaceae bacterium]|nr:bacteriochlorophyll c-binding protein [Chloroflexaceae bacterium]